MNYNLLVFASRAAPRSAADFLAWYQAQTEWPERHDYEDPAVATLSLKAWVMDMMEHFPPQSGPYQEIDAPDDRSLLAEYSIGHEIVFAAIHPRHAASARRWAHALAALHCVGLFEPSEAEQSVWMPDGDNGLRLAFICSNASANS